MWKSRCDKKYKWHKWFAWHPVYIGGYYHWLVMLERRYEMFNPYDGDWEYRIFK